ncbi:MAG: hypothetical protein ACREOF_11460 [Gemmatimonadales bacterium]
MRPLRSLSSAALAAVLLAAAGEASAQEAPRFEPPDLSATSVSLSLTLAGADRPARTLRMGGQGGCQNVGDDTRPNWVVGWSAADGSQLFALTVQGLPNGKTEERFVLKPAGERSFTLTSVAAATITRQGQGVRFSFSGAESGGRTLKGTVSCAGQTT